jgi:hypothetical protein
MTLLTATGRSVSASLFQDPNGPNVIWQKLQEAWQIIQPHCLPSRCNICMALLWLYHIGLQLRIQFRCEHGPTRSFSAEIPLNAKRRVSYSTNPKKPPTENSIDN